MTKKISWANGKVDKDDGNSKKDQQTRETDCQLNDVLWFLKHRFVVKNMDDDLEIDGKTNETNDTEDAGEGPIDL